MISNEIMDSLTTAIRYIILPKCVVFFLLNLYTSKQYVHVDFFPPTFLFSLVITLCHCKCVDNQQSSGQGRERAFDATNLGREGRESWSDTHTYTPTCIDGLCFSCERESMEKILVNENTVVASVYFISHLFL